MNPDDIDRLRRLTSFPALVAYLRDQLDWPIEVEDAEDIVFDYHPAELGIDPQHAVKIDSIKQLRPLVDNQPWAIFFVQFESKRLPVVVLRRILRALVPTSRQRDPDRPGWHLNDLLFVSAQGEAGHRCVSFAHFHHREDRLPELRTFSWDSRETHFHYIKNLNLERLRWPDDEANADAWRARWSLAFTVEHRYAITKSKELAREMAHHAAAVRDLVSEVYALETDIDPLHLLYRRFKEVLLHDLTPDAFADMVAQTVAYGLFSAATQTNDLTYDRMVDLIPKTNPFLKDLLVQLTEEGAVDLEELGIDQLVALMRQTDMEAILRDFGRQSGGGREDPVIHFYEDFMKAYDPAQRVRRGEFYTPDPVVSYIVRSVDYLLKTEFGLPDGLADTSTDPETGEPLVQILDPATGTGTFLAHVIDQIERTVKAKPGADWNAYVRDHLLPRLNGFELMMAPYAVAHMKLGLKLAQTGYDFSGDERLRVFLTNTLEKPLEMHEVQAFAGFLSTESNEASRIKRQARITVVIGNPPYSYQSANTASRTMPLVQDYYRVDGKPLGERNPKGLQDDYVKFIGFGQWLIDRTDCGILAFISNHGYLDNPTFPGMRQSLATSFDDIFVLDLHGSTKKRERTPGGEKDENVFDIQPGVAIGIFVKRPKKREQMTTVHHADLWGGREGFEGHVGSGKYHWLIDNDISTTDWTGLKPRSPSYFFVPQDTSMLAEYEMGWKLTEVMTVNSVGLYSARDHLAIQWTTTDMREVISDFAFLGTEAARDRYDLGPDSRDWKVILAQNDIKSSKLEEDRIRQVSYRPFDRRFTYYTGVSRGLICMPRPEVMQHMLCSDNLAICFMRRSREQIVSNFYVSRHLIDKTILSSLDNANTAPLYLYTTPGSAKGTLFVSKETTREANFSLPFIAAVENQIGLKYISDGRGDLTVTVGPEDIFHYMYAVFHGPAYRARYAEFLKIDFPRIPLTSDRGLFAGLVGLGAGLAALHLLEDDYPATSWNREGRSGGSPLQHPITTFVEGGNGATVGRFAKSKCYHDGRVYLDTSLGERSSHFDGVPEDVWSFHIGGYQVCYKWLYDRRGTKGQPGRTLTEEDIAHYHRIVVALQETIRLMAEIDDVIEEHGGWPIE